jgi:hypothetical protein
MSGRRTSRRPPDPRSRERGVATVEAVLVVPLVLVPVLLAVVTFGDVLHTRPSSMPRPPPERARRR